MTQENDFSTKDRIRTLIALAGAPIVIYGYKSPLTLSSSAITIAGLLMVLQFGYLLVCRYFIKKD